MVSVSLHDICNTIVCGSKRKWEDEEIFIIFFFYWLKYFNFTFIAGSLSTKCEYIYTYLLYIHICILYYILVLHLSLVKSGVRRC